MNMFNSIFVKLIIQFLEKIVATYEQAKAENRDLKIHVLEKSNIF